MKILKPLLLTLATSCAGLHCQSDNIAQLTQALKELALDGTTTNTEQKLRMRELENLEKERLKEKNLEEKPAPASRPFITHMLLTITNMDTKGGENIAMQEEVFYAFENKIPLLVTETQLLIQTTNWQGGTPLPASYRYFKIPSNTGYPHFLLCIPSKILSTTAVPIEDIDMHAHPESYVPKNVSFAEKECGFLIEHCREVTKDVVNKNYNLEYADATHEEMGEQLRSILRVIFVPKTSYKRAWLRPRWALLFSGHGGQYKTYDDNEILHDHKFIKEPGTICGMDAKIFGETIFELHKKIDIALEHIGTCFGGMFNIVYLLIDAEKGLLPPYPTIITTDTLKGDSCTTSKQEYQEFWTELKNITVEGLDDETQLPRLVPSDDSLQQTYARIFRDVYNAIPRALSHIVNKSLLTNDFPAMKPVATNYFVEVQIAGDKPLQRIDAKTVKEQVKKGTPLIIPEQSRAITYVNSLPFILKMERGSSILSGIPGSTFHVFERVETTWAPQDSYWLKDLLQDLEKKTKQVVKLFHVKNWVSEYDGTYEVRIIKNNNDYECLALPDKKDGKDFVLMHNYIYNAEKKDTQKIIPAEEANAWIKKFDDKIVFLKKLANAQAPYRLLKDADIETLPWDA